MFVLSEFHVIRTIRNTKCIAGFIFYFHVNQNFVLSEFVLSGFHCSLMHICCLTDVEYGTRGLVCVGCQ